MNPPGLKLVPPLTARPDWYRTAFSSLVADFWRIAVPAAETQAEVLFLETMLGPPKGRRLLDVMCGSARLARPLAVKGYRVTGLDVSQAMLDDAGREPLPPGLDLICRDMRELDDVGLYGGAYCFGNSFGYIAHEDTVDFLTRLHGALIQGARFVIETGAIAESLLCDFKPEIRMTAGDFRFRALNRYDLKTSVLHTEFRVTRGLQQERFTGSQVVYTTGELNRLMARAGFNLISLYGAPDFRPFRLGVERLMGVWERV